MFYYSRRAREHGELSHYTVFDVVLRTQARVGACGHVWARVGACGRVLVAVTAARARGTTCVEGGNADVGNALRKPCALRSHPWPPQANTRMRALNRRHTRTHTQVPSERIVLDGELIVWNKKRGVFEPFGGLRSTMIAANEGRTPDQVGHSRVAVCLAHHVIMMCGVGAAWLAGRVASTTQPCSRALAAQQCHTAAHVSHHVARRSLR
jgi:hypothetical protein